MKCMWKAAYLGGMLFLVGACNNGSSGQTEKEAVSEEGEVAEIFHTQKKLSYGDSLQLRVLSWGGKITGSYLVLLADSLNQHYIGDSFFRQGILKDVWIDDLDEDGLPEVGVVLQEPQDLRYGRLALHELSQDFKWQTRTFPPLPETLGAAYGGGDSIYIRDDKVIVREFNLLNRLDTLSQNSMRRRILYGFENNQLQLSGSEEMGLTEE